MLTLEENIALRSVLAEAYRDAPDEVVQELLDELASELNAAELAAVSKALNQVKKALPGIANLGQQALPGVIQGATTGATVGGPWGALIGGIAGGGLSLAGGVKPKTRRPVRRPGVQASRPTHPTAFPSPRTSSPALQTPSVSKSAAQLLQILQDPKVLQVLLALTMGNAGKKNLTVGKSVVSPPAILDLIKTLVGRTAQESEDEHPATTEGYLLDQSGKYAFDPANPDDRADALVEHLTSNNSDWQETLLDPVEWLNQPELVDDDDSLVN